MKLGVHLAMFKTRKYDEGPNFGLSWGVQCVGGSTGSKMTSE